MLKRDRKSLHIFNKTKNFIKILFYAFVMAEQFLVPLEQYLKVGIHIGTKFRTKYMEPFIYKVRPDGLAVLNVQEIDKRIGIAAKMLSKYEPNSILVVGRRENSWKSVEMFAKATGIRVLIKRYPPGILTNQDLEDFTEIKLLFATDPIPDKNAVRDAVKIGIPVIALCDTNNEANYVDLIIPCNNKGKKSLGLIFWILAKEYLRLKGVIKSEQEMKYSVDDFSDEE